MAVITAFKLENAISIGGCARDPQSAHHGFGAGRNEAQHLDPWEATGNPFGQLERIGFARAETPGGFDGFPHGCGHVRIAMPEH
jgi:hypothetical protein